MSVCLPFRMTSESGARGPALPLNLIYTADSHLLVCSQHIRTLRTGEDQPIMPMLQRRDVHIQHLFDVVRQLLSLGDELERELISPFRMLLEASLEGADNPASQAL